MGEFLHGTLQIYSIVSSVVSLAWSFTTYEAIQKKGALDFSFNPLGRIVTVLSLLLQVSIVKPTVLRDYSNITKTCKK